MIIHSNCLEWMQTQPDDCVDLVFGSPPYEDARLYGIDFRLAGQDWVDWMVPQFLEMVRICKGLVAVVVEGRTRDFRWSATPALLMADLHRAGVRLRKPPIYHRIGIPGSGGPDWWRNDYEFTLCATKGRLPWSDNTATGHPPKWAPGGEMSYRLTDGTRRNQWGGSGSKGSTRARKKDGSREPASGRPSHMLKKCGASRRANGEMKKAGYDMPVLANPGNIIRCKVGGGLMGSKLAHENEAPFPEALVEPYVLSFCPPGGVVYDPWCGSGTTLAVAKRFGRRFIGTDVRESQVELTRKRLAQTQPELLQ